MQVLLHDDYQVAIDGCKARCPLRTFQKAGIKIDLSYALDEDFGLEKSAGLEFDEKEMLKVAERIKRDIEELQSQGGSE